MRKNLLTAITLLLSMACAQDFEEQYIDSQASHSFKVGVETIDTTRVQLDENCKMIWNEGDLLSVFNRKYDNLIYKFEGKTGDTHGTIVQQSEASGVNDIVSNKRVALYPYDENYKILYEDGYVEAYLPIVQHYRKGSFGVDGNVMIGVSEDNTFQLRSVCGWLCVKLRGDGERIRRISVQSKDKQLSGHVYISIDDASIISDPYQNLISGGDIDDDELVGNLNTGKYDYTVLYCGENGIELTDHETTFYIALPPAEYNSLTVIAELIDDDNIILRTENPITIKRNTICPMNKLDNTEARIKTCEYYLDAIHDNLLTSVNGFDHSDFGYPSIGISNDYACKLVVNGGWTVGNTYYYNRFQHADIGQNYNPTSPVSLYYWYNYYSSIELCNQFIAMISGDESLEVYEGLARTFRAMLYIDLARLYECLYAVSTTNGAYESEYYNVAGLTVPIVDENTSVESAKNNPRATRGELFNFVFNDLKFAEEALVNYNSSSYSMPNISVVYGLYARAYMWLGGFEDGFNGDLPSGSSAYSLAADYARKAIKAHGGAVMTRHEWTNPMTAFNTVASSWMWALVQRNDTILNNLFQFIAHISPDVAYGYSCLAQVGVSSEAYNHLSETDFRKLVIKGPDKTWEEFAPYTLLKDSEEFYSYADYTNFKFRPANGERYDYMTAAIVPLPLMRSEEMYFIEMEAELHVNGDAAAAAKLDNFIKTHRDPHYEMPNISVLDEILFHKSIEFWGEGIVMYDMKRLNIGVNTYNSTNYYEAASIASEGRLPWWTPCIPQSVVDDNVALQGKNNPDPSQIVL